MQISHPPISIVSIAQVPLLTSIPLSTQIKIKKFTFYQVKALQLQSQPMLKINSMKLIIHLTYSCLVLELDI